MTGRSRSVAVAAIALFLAALSLGIALGTVWLNLVVGRFYPELLVVALLLAVASMVLVVWQRLGASRSDG